MGPNYKTAFIVIFRFFGFSDFELFAAPSQPENAEEPENEVCLFKNSKFFNIFLSILSVDQKTRKQIIHKPENKKTNKSKTAVFVAGRPPGSD